MRKKENFCQVWVLLNECDGVTAALEDVAALVHDVGSGEHHVHEGHVCLGVGAGRVVLLVLALFALLFLTAAAYDGSLADNHRRSLLLLLPLSHPQSWPRIQPWRPRFPVGNNNSKRCCFRNTHVSYCTKK